MNKEKSRKLLLSLGSLAAITIPLTTVVACSINPLAKKPNEEILGHTPTVKFKGFPDDILVAEHTIGLSVDGTHIKDATTDFTIKVHNDQDPSTITNDQFKAAFTFNDEEDGLLSGKKIRVDRTQLNSNGGLVKIIATDSDGNTQTVNLRIILLSD